MISPDVYAYIGGLAAMVSFVPQVIKTWQTKSSRDISWLMIIVTMISVGGYELYALSLGLLPVVIMNGIFLVTVVALAGLKATLDRQ